MKTLTAPTPYGYQELRQNYQHYMLLAMGFSIFVQLMIISGYHMFQQVQIDPPTKGGTVVEITKLLPPPLQPPLGMPEIPFVSTKFSAGIPVPVPGSEVDPETDFAGQKELAQQANQQWEKFEGGSENANIIIEEKDPLPTEFRIVEKYPEVVFKAVPEYPDIARRVALEGNVWVQILIAKDGKVKKALAVTSDADVFVEPVKEAAMKWVFTPGIMNGKPVAVWVTIPFRFRLTSN
jgi:periplasmic protein TonB